MVTIKSYTSLEQSKKLAEILPLESADMYWVCENNAESRAYYGERPVGACLFTTHCWSLAALLNILPKIYYPVKDHPTYLILGKPKDKWCALYWDITGMQHGEQTLADNPVDACVNMILKLHELNVL